MSALEPDEADICEMISKRHQRLANDKVDVCVESTMMCKQRDACKIRVRRLVWQAHNFRGQIRNVRAQIGTVELHDSEMRCRRVAFDSLKVELYESWKPPVGVIQPEPDRQRPGY